MSWASRWLAVGLLAAGVSCTQREAGHSMGIPDSVPKLEKELMSRHGEAEWPRIPRGLKQDATFWKG
jgi:hypothetical protein